MKTYFISLMAASAIASTSFAFMPSNHLQFLQNKIASNTKTTISSQNYTDFSGTWRGGCDGTDTTTLIIKNDEKYIYINYLIGVTGINYSYTIGDAFKSESLSSKKGAATFHTAIFWNTDKTQLIESGTGVIKSLNDATDEGTPLSTLIYTTVYSMNKDQLVMQSDSITFSGTEQKEKRGPVTCTYKKQSKNTD